MRLVFCIYQNLKSDGLSPMLSWGAKIDDVISQIEEYKKQDIADGASEPGEYVIYCAAVPDNFNGGEYQIIDKEAVSIRMINIGVRKRKEVKNG